MINYQFDRAINGVTLKKHEILVHLFAIVANNAYLCLVLADEICYGISSLGLEAKDCETAKAYIYFCGLKRR